MWKTQQYCCSTWAITILTPKIPWDQKLVVFCLGSMWEEKCVFFIYLFSLDEWTTNFTRFLATPSMSNSDFVWVHGELLFKWIVSSFSEDHLHAIMWLNYPRAAGQGAKREVFFAHRILGFHFFPILFFAHGPTWCHLQCDCYDLNVDF